MGDAEPLLQNENLCAPMIAMNSRKAHFKPGKPGEFNSN
jgi:hypothetical protein